MPETTIAIRLPDLSATPFHLTAERIIPVSPEVLFTAWTEQFDLWVRRAEVDLDERGGQRLVLLTTTSKPTLRHSAIPITAGS